MKAATLANRRLSMNLSDLDKANIDLLVTTHQIGVTDAVRRALKLYAHVTEQEASRLVMFTSDGKARELVLL